MGRNVHHCVGDNRSICVAVRAIRFRKSCGELHLPLINALGVPNQFHTKPNLALSGVHLSVIPQQRLVEKFCNRCGITLLPVILAALCVGLLE
jgi:hypothetical protein